MWNANQEPVPACGRQHVQICRSDVARWAVIASMSTNPWKTLVQTRISVLQVVFLTARFSLIRCQPLVRDRVSRLAQVLSHRT